MNGSIASFKTGKFSESKPEDCFYCNGSGIVAQRMDKTGFFWNIVCSHCNGKGWKR